MSEVNGVSEQIKILFNEKTQDIKELLDCVKKCIEIIKELKRENEYLKTMNDGLEQQKAELINLLCERCDYIGACEVEEILCAVKKYK